MDPPVSVPLQKRHVLRQQEPLTSGGAQGLLSQGFKHGPKAQFWFANPLQTRRN